MANPNFIGMYSTNNIWRAANEDICLEDDLVIIEDAITALESDKSDTDHTHTGYAASTHAHAQSDVTGLADTLAEKAAANHTHNYAASTHGHAQSDVTGLATALSGKAEANHTHDGFAPSTHTHAQSDVTGLATVLGAKADLVDGKVPESQLPSFVSDVIEGTLANFPTTGESGKIYVDTTTNKSYRWGGTQYTEIAGGVALGETSATAYRGDRGKTAYDHSQNSAVHVTAAQKTAWDAKAAGTHTHAQSDITGLSDALAEKAPATHTHTGFAAESHSHAQSDITGLATALAEKAASNHTHTAADIGAIAKALQFTNDAGGVEYFYGSGSGKNLLTEMAAWPQGVHTAYSIGSTAGNPKDTESWRILCHKTSDVIGWVLAFGTSGSIYSNYYDTGWKGWKCIYDALPAPLWTGGMYMTETHEIIPTKALSACAHGWLLLWSDYNPGSGVGNTDFATTMIPKYAYTGQKWNGGQFLCAVPRFADDTGEAISVKTLKVYDTKLAGVAYNDENYRNDVVIRAIYEF